MLSENSLGFRVPAHPEGLRSADRFDTYWGHVSDLPDFTQARRCCRGVRDSSPQPSVPPDRTIRGPAGYRSMLYSIVTTTRAILSMVLLSYAPPYSEASTLAPGCRM